jgi:hypothetical protein
MSEHKPAPFRQRNHFFERYLTACWFSHLLPSCRNKKSLQHNLVPQGRWSVHRGSTLLPTLAFLRAAMGSLLCLHGSRLPKALITAQTG